MSRLRILRVIARMNVGGPAMQVVGLAEELDRERFDQRILVGDVGDDEGDYLALRAPHVQLTRVSGLGRSPDPTGDLRALASIAGHVRRFRPDIIHTHTAKAGTLGRLAALASPSARTVHTFHGHLLNGYFSPLVTRGVITTEKVLARRTTRLVAVGERVRDELLAAGIGRPDQYDVVPPGIPLPDPIARDEARATLGLPSEGLVVGFVARLTKVKRPDRFVEMAAAVEARRPGTTFVVAGDGDLLAESRAQAEASRVAVRFLGWRSDVETIYAASDVVVLTSDNEGMPVSLIEAGAMGRPSVTTDVGSAREVVLDGSTGRVVPLDATALADAVVSLLDDPARRDAFGEAASRHVRASFSRSRLVTQTAALYESVAAVPRRDRRRS